MPHLLRQMTILPLMAGWLRVSIKPHQIKRQTSTCRFRWATIAHLWLTSVPAKRSSSVRAADPHDGPFADRTKSGHSPFAIIAHATSAPSSHTRTPSFSASALRSVKSSDILGIEWNETCISSSPGWWGWPVMAIDMRLLARRSASSKVDCSSSGDLAVFFATLTGTSARNRIRLPVLLPECLWCGSRVMWK